MGLTQASFAWQHDALGSVTGQDETWAAAGSGQPARTRSTVNTYDLAGRLDTETITEVIGGSASPPVTTTYSYDAAHNRTHKLVEGASGAEDWTYTYNVANQLTQSVKTHAAGPVETTTYGYDTNGNRTSRDKRIGGSGSSMTLYQWNAWDRLIGVNLTDAKKFSYTYDHRARRVAVAQATSGGLAARYTAVTFSGGLSVAEFESTTAVVGTVAAVQYIRGPDMGGGVGGLLRTVRNPVSASTSLPVAPTAATPATHRYNLSNGRGDIVAQSNAVGELTWTASYEAYGKRTKETGANADKQRANSKDEDPTGLLNEGFRYRDLETGVWMSRDPAGFVDGPNLYAYVKQNPWTAFDPKGLSLKVPRGEVQKVESYMKKHGVSGQSVEKDNKSWLFPEKKITGGPTKSAKHTSTLTGEILAGLTNSDHEFGFKSFKDLERHVNARVDGVNAAKNIKAQYSMGRKSQVFGKDGVMDSQGRLVPKAGKTYKEALESTLNDPSCVIDCSKAAGFPLQVGMLNQGDTITDRGSEVGTGRRDSSRDTNDWIPGDWGYLREYGTDSNFVGPVGENILYLGGNEWVGHDNPRHVLPKTEMDARTDIQTMRRYPMTGLGQ